MGINNDKGSALVMVMAMALVLTILGTAMLGVTVSEYRMEKAYRNSAKAYYLAEAGMEKALFEITKLEDIAADDLRTSTWNLENEDLDLLDRGGSGNFTVTVKTVSLSDIIYTDESQTEAYKYIYEIVLRSEGVAEGSSRMIEAKIRVEDWVNGTADDRLYVLYWRQIN